MRRSRRRVEHGSQAGDVTTLSNCPIISNYGHSGAYICETTRAFATWILSDGSVIVDHVVIGTNFFIYTKARELHQTGEKVLVA
jgi:hypothetical protein